MATSEELKSQINSLLMEINLLSNQLGGDFVHIETSTLLKEENTQIQTHLTDFTTKEGVLLTIASLFSFLSFSDDNISAYFPIFTLSFLILAIIFYTLSSKRFHIIQSVRIDSDLNLLTPKEINDILKQSYFRTLKYHSITDALIVAYFISFTFNYYFNFYFRLPDLKVSIIIWVAAILCGIWRYLNVKNKTDVEGVVGTGCPALPKGVVSFGGVTRIHASEIPEDKK